MYTSVQNFFFQKTIFKKICIVLGVHCIFCGACSKIIGDDGQMVNAELLLIIIIIIIWKDLIHRLKATQGSKLYHNLTSAIKGDPLKN